MTTHQSLVLGFFIAIGLVVVSVCGEHFEVASAQQLIKVLNISEANNFDANITLLDDLDFSDSPLTLPLGAFSNGTCVPFSGVFQGNGHSIHGVVMKNKDSQGFNHAGLFCSLKDATVENLVIDSSCSFNGSSAGALCVSVNGSLVVRNVTNKAQVNGTAGVGGFVGYVRDLRDVSVSFEDCVNGGTVTGSSCVGGFVGWIFGNTNMTMTISNSNNNGNVTGSSNVGGFVGRISNNTDMNMTIAKSTNSGIVYGSSYVGGFVGGICYNTIMSITISKSTNNGSVTGGGNKYGGFAGSLFNNTKITLIISSSANNGNITGSSNVGGFVGEIYSYQQSNSISLFINSANKGSVLAKNGMACGVFCFGPNDKKNAQTTIMNSINKGSVNATTYAYGITNNITKARNVVSMGDVTGSSGSFSFWKSSTDIDLFFGLKSKCVNCSTNPKLFEYNTNTGFYEVVESHELVHDLLNDEAVNQHFGMVWTTELELVHKLNMIISVSGLFDVLFVVESGTPLGRVGNLSLYFNNEEYGVVSEKDDTMIVHNSAHLVSRNMDLIVGRLVKMSVGSPINKSEIIIGGKTLEWLAHLFSFSFDDFIVVDGNTYLVLNKSTMIERDTTLKLCHIVNISGSFNNTYIVEHGTKLGEISGIDGFWNSQFTVLNTRDGSKVCKRETGVLSDMELRIVKGTRVVVEITPTNEVNTSEVIKSIRDIIDEDPQIVGVDVVLDDDGQVTGIIVIVENESAATTIVEAINGMETGTGCVGGVLCRAKRAFVDTEPLSLSLASFSFAQPVFFLLSFLYIFHFM